jgi:hypothetical protein
MESQRLAETQGFPPITGSPLTDRGMPALGMSPPARRLVHGAMGRPGEDGSSGRPKAPIGFRPPSGGLRRRPRPAGCADVQTFRSFHPTKLHNSSTSRMPLPRPAARSRLPGGGPSRWRPHTASAVPAGGPAPHRPAKSAPSAPPCTAPWAPRPHRPHRPCRGTAGSRIDSVRSRIGGTGKSGPPESWHPSEGGFPL